MIAPIEPPPEVSKDTRFSPANAAEMAAKSWQKRREREAAGIEESQKREQTPLERQIERVAKQLARLENALDSIELKKDPAAARDLSAAHSRLFDTWCTLTGTQKPGTLRVSKRRDRDKETTSAPTFSTPTPQPIVSVADSARANALL